MKHLKRHSTSIKGSVFVIVRTSQPVKTMSCLALGELCPTKKNPHNVIRVVQSQFELIDYRRPVLQRWLFTRQGECNKDMLLSCIVGNVGFSGFRILNCKVSRFSISLLALYILISWWEQNRFIPPLLLLASLHCPLPVPRALLCVINYDCTGWQHTATVLINYWLWEELFLSFALSLSPPIPLSLSTFFSCLIIFAFLLYRRQNIPEHMINVFSTFCLGSI